VIAFAASQFVFAGYSGEPFSNRAFNLRLRAACRALGVGEHHPRAPALRGNNSAQPRGEGFAGICKNPQDRFLQKVELNNADIWPASSDAGWSPRNNAFFSPNARPTRTRPSLRLQMESGFSSHSHLTTFFSEHRGLAQGVSVNGVSTQPATLRPAFRPSPLSAAQRSLAASRRAR
jgi:hypothetical protein